MKEKLSKELRKTLRKVVDADGHIYTLEMGRHSPTPKDSEIIGRKLFKRSFIDDFVFCCIGPFLVAAKDKDLRGEGDKSGDAWSVVYNSKGLDRHKVILNFLKSYKGEPSEHIMSLDEEMFLKGEKETYEDLKW